MFNGHCRWNCRVADQLLADALEARFISFAVRIIKLAGAIPTSPTGRHVASQLLRSGTSPAPNYAEARSAESDSDFVHKMSIVLKELNETLVWLRIIAEAKLLTRGDLIHWRTKTGNWHAL